MALRFVRHPVRPRYLPAAVAVAAVALLAGGCGSSKNEAGSSAPDSPYALTRPAAVGSLSLPDATQGLRPLSFVAPGHGILLVYFGYTRCPDICPTTLSDLGVAVRGLPKAEQARVAAAFITVDPARDTPAVLAGYIHSFFRDGHALRTADPARLAAVAKAFGAAYEVTRKKDGTVDVVHTATVFAVDDTGHVVLGWPFGTKPATYRQSLRSFLASA